MDDAPAHGKWRSEYRLHSLGCQRTSSCCGCSAWAPQKKRQSGFWSLPRKNWLPNWPWWVSCLCTSSRVTSCKCF